MVADDAGVPRGHHLHSCSVNMVATDAGNDVARLALVAGSLGDLLAAASRLFVARCYPDLIHQNLEFKSPAMPGFFLAWCKGHCSNCDKIANCLFYLDLSKLLLERSYDR